MMIDEAMNPASFAKLFVAVDSKPTQAVYSLPGGQRVTVQAIERDGTVVTTCGRRLSASEFNRGVRVS